MQNIHLVDYIKKNYNIEPLIIDAIKYELDQHIFYYGQHFKHSKEKQTCLASTFKSRTIKIFRKFVALNISILKPNLYNSNKNVLSNAYFSINAELRKLNFNVYRPAWSIGRDLQSIVDHDILKEIEYFKESFEDKDFIELINKEFLNRITSFKAILRRYFLDHGIEALCVPNDMGFFERISVDLFKVIEKPSFLFLHGLPGRYNSIDDNRSDYLVVWGDKIKDNYVNAGIPREKIFVSGHPYYQQLLKSPLRYSLEAPLIITKTMNGAQHSDSVRLSNRGNLILYLYSIQSVLRRLGVERVRFRPHPSENPAWYSKFLDNNFFREDHDNLHDSLRKSSVVIGPTTTVFLECIYYGVNYICYEPSFNGIDLLNFNLVPPFDGTDERLPVAMNEDQLEQIIKDRSTVDVSIFYDYIKIPFDLSFVKSMI